MMRMGTREKDDERDDTTKFSGMPRSLIHDQLYIYKNLQRGESRDGLLTELPRAPASQARPKQPAQSVLFIP